MTASVSAVGCMPLLAGGQQLNTPLVSLFCLVIALLADERYPGLRLGPLRPLKPLFYQDSITVRAPSMRPRLARIVSGDEAEPTTPDKVPADESSRTLAVLLTIQPVFGITHLQSILTISEAS
jgi:hypothetical protein